MSWPLAVEKYINSMKIKTQKQQPQKRKAYAKREKPSSRLKLTSKQINEILKSDLAITVLATKYGVSTSTISRVRTGKTYTHLQKGE